MRKVVTYAKLQNTDAFIPGIGGLGNTLPPSHKSLDLKMYEDTDEPGKLFVEATFKGLTTKAGVPLGNVQIMVYAPEAPKKEKEAKAS